MGTLTLAWHAEHPIERRHPITLTSASHTSRSHPMDETRQRLELALWIAAAVVALVYTYLI